MTHPHFLKNTIKGIVPDSLLMHKLPAAAKNTILLTFDDGPDEKLTPIILDQLKIYNARAVFFVIGEKVEKSPDITKKIYQQGHLIGNHTYSHPYQKIPSLRQYSRDIRRCQNVIAAKIKKKSIVYRPPAGIISISGLILTRLSHLKTILWSIEGGEWGVYKKDSAQTIGKRLKADLQPRDIVLLHDNNEKVPFILDIIMPDIKKREIDLQQGVDFLCP